MAVLRLPDPNLLLSKPRSQKILGLAAARRLCSAGLRQIQSTVTPEDLTCPLLKLARKDLPFPFIPIVDGVVGFR